MVAAAVGTGLTADNTEFTVDTTELTADLVGLPGSVLHITVTAPFSQAPQAECVWTLESRRCRRRPSACLPSSARKGWWPRSPPSSTRPGKFDNVDFGTRLDPKPITVVPPSVQAAPQNIRLASRSVIDQGIARHVAEISWAAAPSAVAYHVQWRRDNSDWVEAGRTGSLTLELPTSAPAPAWRGCAPSTSPTCPRSGPARPRPSSGDLAPPPALAQLATQSQVFGIGLRWDFRKDSFTAQRTEIWYGPTNDRASDQTGDFAFPQNAHTLSGLSAGKRFSSGAASSP